MASDRSSYALKDIQDLLYHRAPWCVSIYLPTHKTGEDQQQDRIRLKNHCKQVQHELTKTGISSTEASHILEPVDDYLADPDNRLYMDEGLAIFLAPRLARFVRLPAVPQEISVVSRSFHITPLLRMAHFQHPFYILCLSRARARLYLCDYSGTQDITPRQIPSPEQALMIDNDEKGMQFREGAPGAQAGKPGSYHGQGSDERDAPERTGEYFHAVNNYVRPLLKQPVPLITAGIPQERSLYREANSYPLLLENGIDENPFDMSEKKLYRRGLEIVKNLFLQKKDREAQEFVRRQGKNPDGITKNVEHAISLAREGNVRSLFVAEERHLWGRYDAENFQIERHTDRQPGDIDLSDVASVETLRQGGEVYAIGEAGIPEGWDLAALKRY
ncbi:MAG: hypothetical protein GF398_10885 [Chitinivibrionales bacterium]|nr:hypothetical protein [Chitinivibrionales bacterium]